MTGILNGYLVFNYQEYLYYLVLNFKLFNPPSYEKIS